MAEQPFFSVIVPVYNVEKYIDECIESVLKQSYQNFELILVDDGSTDGSGSKCDKFADNNSSCVVFHKSNEGQLATRRFGIEKAKGEYFVFLDSDDYLELNALECIYKVIINTESDLIIYNYRKFVGTRTIGTSITGGKQVIIDNKCELFKYVLFDNKYNSLCRKAVHRSLIDPRTDYTKFYNISLAEDLLQSLELYGKCKKSVLIPDILYNYRMNENSMTHSITFENYKIDFTVRKEVLRFLREQNVFNKGNLKQYHSYCCHLLYSSIINIVGIKTSLRNKVTLLKKIKNDEYYIDYLMPVSCEGKPFKEIIILKLFEKGFLYPIAIVCNIIMR